MVRLVRDRERGMEREERGREGGREREREGGNSWRTPFLIGLSITPLMIPIIEGGNMEEAERRGR